MDANRYNMSHAKARFRRKRPSQPVNDQVDVECNKPDNSLQPVGAQELSQEQEHMNQLETCLSQVLQVSKKNQVQHCNSPMKSENITLDNVELDALDRLLKVSLCLMCTERLTPSVLCCVNGHAICKLCGQGKTNCPTCKNPLSEDKTMFLSNVLLSLPGECKHPGCDQIKFNILEHEKYCLFRKTICQECDWKGSVMDLYTHIKDIHWLTRVWKLGDEQQNWFNLSKSNRYASAFIIQGQIFWRIGEVDLDKNLISINFICVPLRKVEEVNYISIELTNEHVVTKNQIKLSFEPVEDSSTLNCVIFHLGMMKQLANNQNELCFKMTLEKGE